MNTFLKLIPVLALVFTATQSYSQTTSAILTTQTSENFEYNKKQTNISEEKIDDGYFFTFHRFNNPIQVTKFIQQNNIKKHEIETISSDGGWQILYYWQKIRNNKVETLSIKKPQENKVETLSIKIQTQ